MEAHIFKSHSDIFLFEQHPHLPNADASQLVANLPETEEKGAALIIIPEQIEITANNQPKTEVLIKGVSNLTEKETVNYFIEEEKPAVNYI